MQKAIFYLEICFTFIKNRTNCSTDSPWNITCETLQSDLYREDPLLCIHP